MEQLGDLVDAKLDDILRDIRHRDPLLLHSPAMIQPRSGSQQSFGVRGAGASSWAVTSAARHRSAAKCVKQRLIDHRLCFKS
jgi:hypothetical protein